MNKLQMKMIGTSSVALAAKDPIAGSLGRGVEVGQMTEAGRSLTQIRTMTH